MNINWAIQSQNQIYNIFKNAKSKDRLSHAYLFYGNKGTGKKEMAYALSMIALCKNNGCGECEVCQAILNDNYMNLTYLCPENNKKVITKEQISALQEKFSKTSIMDGKRIYIVDGIDTATSAAQNSILKFIEEPQNKEQTIGIFIANELSNVVSTIKSRCVLQFFNDIKIDDRINELANNGMPLLDSELASILTNNVIDAYQIIESDDYVIAKGMFLELIDINKDDLAVLYFLKFSKVINDKNLEMLIKWLLIFLEDTFKLKNDNNLILKEVYDKIIIYKKRNNDNLISKLDIILEIYNKMRYYISSKNLFHELIFSFI